MALSNCPATVDVIANLSDAPVQDGTKTVEQFKDAFDQAGREIKAYINSTLIPQITAQFQAALDAGNKLDPAYLDVDSDQLRHIFVVDTEPTGASPDGIYLVTE